MATAHTSPSEANDAGLVVDIDLSVLALHPAGYAEYTRAVRQEYQWVSYELFQAERSKVLQSFLAIPRLYSHSSTIDAWEVTARFNIKAELGSITPVFDKPSQSRFKTRFSFLISITWPIQS